MPPLSLRHPVRSVGLLFSSRAWLKGLASFMAVCSVGAVANVGIGSLVYDRIHGWAIAGIAGAIVGSVWNYVASSWLTWTKR